MQTIQIIGKDLKLIDPFPPVKSTFREGEAETAFSIEIAGIGHVSGLSYTVPAHTSGSIKATLQVMALTSSDVENLNKMARGMLDASYREQINDYERTSISANLSMWSWCFGGGGASASYEKTHSEMKSKGLTENQITMLMDAFLENAKKMSSVQIDFYVNNEQNDYSVSGDIYLYTVSGTIKTEKGTHEYRLLADQAAAGGPPSSGGGAPSSGKIIPIK
jgi:hypothetical protein